MRKDGLKGVQLLEIMTGSVTTGPNFDRNYGHSSDKFFNYSSLGGF